MVRVLAMNSNEMAGRETRLTVENNRAPELRFKGFMASVLPYLMMKRLHRALSSLAGYYSSRNRRCACLVHLLNLYMDRIPKRKFWKTILRQKASKDINTFRMDYEMAKKKPELIPKVIL